jgi:hypothetical protein
VSHTRKARRSQIQLLNQHVDHPEAHLDSHPIGRLRGMFGSLVSAPPVAASVDRAALIAILLQSIWIELQ